MYILLEKDDFLEVLKYSDSNIRKFYCSKSFDNFFQEYNKLDEKTVILIDEENFSFFSYNINKKVDKKFSIDDLKNIIKDKEKESRMSHNNIWILVNYSIDDIFVDWQQQSYLIWKKWDISFDINLFFLNPEKESLFEISKWSDFLEKMEIYPSSFFTFNFLKSSFQKNDMYLLYIYENEAKIVEFKNWFYNNISKIPLWISSLKEVFKEKDIMNFYFKSFNSEQVNNFAESLIKESLDFYCWLLIKWLNENMTLGSNVFLVSELIKNKYFLEIFGKYFSDHIQWFVTPFNKVDSFEKKWIKWDYSDVDILSFLNSR